MSDLAIDLRDVAKRYRGKIDALKGIEMHVRRGEVFGLLGPNGAGKSTLVKIIMTIVRATRAGGTVLGRPIGHKPTLARMGYLPENHRFPRYLTGRQAVEFFGALSGVDRAARRKRAAELIDLVGMGDAADRKIATYSKGMAQRIGLAQSLVNDPDLVLLDEPTDGVDPVGRREIRDVLGVLRTQGKTVFINSHQLSELEMICDRVAILLAGRVVRQGTLSELTAASQGALADLTRVSERFEIEVAPPGPPGAAMPPVGQLAGLPVRPVQVPQAGGNGAGKGALPPRSIELGELPDGARFEIEGPLVRAATTNPMAVQPILDALRRAGLCVVRVQFVRPSLEELFLDAVAAEAATAAGGPVPGAFPVSPPPVPPPSPPAAPEPAVAVAEPAGGVQ